MMMRPISGFGSEQSAPVEYQLVLQFRGESRDEYDAMIVLEDELIDKLTGAQVDGHDIGSGKRNIFIFTFDPAGTFRQSQPILERLQSLQAVTAAYRRVDGSDYTVIWPVGSTEEFRV